MEFKGTKGKWKIEYLCDENSIRASLNKGSIDVWTDMNEVTIEEANANALLISKAPEMLEALKTTLNELREINVLNNHSDYLEQLIKEATEL